MESVEDEFWSEKFFALFEVMGGAMMLGKVVGSVVGAGSPVVLELISGITTS